jgi:hypothetical protein
MQNNQENFKIKEMKLLLNDKEIELGKKEAIIKNNNQ